MLGGELIPKHTNPNPTYCTDPNGWQHLRFYQLWL